ncbi:MAG: tetratricopeptide repeat protein [Myxococcales bacterium]|nr:tetratricopeptide repeat protein [Myxococcales bacterium]MCB9707512.1 tetratricopeptide repeat protein [Myxococcales bacterium]
MTHRDDDADLTWVKDKPVEDDALTIARPSEPVRHPLPRAKGALDDPHWLRSRHRRRSLAQLFTRLKLKRLPELPWHGSLTGSLIVLALLLLGSAVSAFFAVRAFLEHRAFDRTMSLVEVASDNGLYASLDVAIQFAKQQRDPYDRFKALRARLLAVGQLEHGIDHAREAQALLRSLSPAARSLLDAHLAYAYLYLERGEVVAARSVISATSPSDDNEHSSEAARARSLTAQASGDFTRAELDARAAAIQRGYAPRHAALAARLRARNGDVKGALRDLDRAPDGDRSPVVRLARARILVEYAHEFAQAEREADEVLQALGSLASPPQRAEAFLIKAQVALAAGRFRLARRHVERAELNGPRWQDSFGMDMCETMLRAKLPANAAKMCHSLPTISTDPERRAQLHAELALSRHHVDQVQVDLQISGDATRTRLLRAGLHELRGELQEARRLFEQATADPTLSAEAYAGLARIAINEGLPHKSIAVLEEGLTHAPGHLGLMIQLAHAQIRADLVQRAHQTLKESMVLYPKEPEVLMLAAWIDLADDHPTTALRKAEAARAADTQDSNLALQLGKIAQAVGNCRAARSAYQSVLMRAPEHRDALLGLADAETRCGNIVEAQAVLHRMEPLLADSREYNEVRARLLVLMGTGHAGALTVEAFPDKTGALWADLGMLWFQAEQYQKAYAAFSKALKAQPDLPRAIMGLAWCQLQKGQLNQARGQLEKAAMLITDNSSAWMQATILGMRARIAFETGDFEHANAWATQAVGIDPSSSTAQHVLALIAQQRDKDRVARLRLAVQGSEPLPEVFAALAKLLPHSEEACQLSQRYLSAAPTGYDRDQMQDLARACSHR